MKYVGVDGCRGGWFVFWLDGEQWGMDVYEDWSSLWTVHADAAILLVDIPIGLPQNGTRQADILIRKQVKGRSSSVFNTPVRSAVYAATKPEARSISQSLSGKSLSEQSLMLIPKIVGVDQFLLATKSARGKVREAFPEFCFAQIVGKPLSYSKKDFLGGLERLEIVKEFVPDSVDIMHGVRSKWPKSVVQCDDVLDAMILAVTGQLAQGHLSPLPDPPEVDGAGLEMAVWYYENGNKG